MAIPVTPKPAYPNVPNLPGTPSVLRSIDTVQNTAVLLVADAQSIISMFSAGPKWGLYTSSGQPAFSGAGASGIIATITDALSGPTQSVGQLEFRSDYRVATAPQEQGAFLSYNKVATPFAGRVSYVISGTPLQRRAAINAVSVAQKGMTLYSLWTPEGHYDNCAVVHYDFRRSARNGLTMFVIDIWVEEIRITATAAYSNPAAPSGADQVNNGTVQPTSPTPAQSSAGQVMGPR